MRDFTWVFSLCALLVTGCGSAGPYGHARVYAPLSEEGSAAEHAVDYDPVMVKRAPEKWRGKVVSVFGVVLGRSSGPTGAADLKLSVRTLEPRNLCEDAQEDSCRVTVSDHEYAVVHALVRLDAEDDLGAHSIGPQSLVRVVGTVTDTVDGADGEPVVRGSYYRHWPRGFYVTSADRKYLRR